MCVCVCVCVCVLTETAKVVKWIISKVFRHFTKEICITVIMPRMSKKVNAFWLSFHGNQFAAKIPRGLKQNANSRHI